MKAMPRIALLAVSLLLLTLCSGQAWSSQSWKIGHVRSKGSVMHGDVQQFVDNIAGRSGGSITMDIYAGSRLGDYSVVQERVSFGEVEMFIGPFGTAVDKRVALSFTPFLVDDWREARLVYAPSSPLRKHMDDFLAEQNIKILGGYPVYFGGLALTEKPERPLDPSVKNKAIIRVPPIRSFERTARVLGYTPYPITWMYAKMGLKTGMVKGMLGGGAEGYAGLPALRCYLPIQDHFEYWYIYMNLDLWRSLEAEEQEILLQAAQEMEQKRYQVAERHEQESLERLQKLGVEIIPVSDEVYKVLQDKVRENVWPVLEEEIGQPFRDVVEFVEGL